MPAYRSASGSPALPESNTLSLPPLLRTFQFWTDFFFTLSVAFHLFFYFVLRQGGHLAYPFSLSKRDRFADFTVFTDKFPAYHTAAFFHTGLPILYPAPVWVIFNFFFKHTGPHALFVYVTFAVLAFIIPAVLFGRTLFRKGIAPARVVLFVSVLCLLSWPVDLIIDGGNSEVFVWLTLAVAMWAYATDRKWVAAILFGIAASLKLFPFVFLSLFFYRRQIGKIVVGAASFFLSTLWSIKFTGPTFAIAYRGYLGGLDWARYSYFEVWHVQEQGVDHSLFATIKLILIATFHRHDLHKASILFSGPLRIYNLATAATGIVLYVLYIRKLPLLNQVLILTIVSIYFTPFSGDGTLIHLYYPLAMLFLLAIKAHDDGVDIPGLAGILYCMVFCLSMESFLVVPYHEEGVRFIGTAHCIALGIMLIAALRYPLGPPLAEGYGEMVLSQPVTGWAKKVLEF